MIHLIRGKPEVRRVVSSVIAFFCMFCLSMTVHASNAVQRQGSHTDVENTKIDTLFIVDNTSGGHVDKMKAHVGAQYLHNGDVNQHEWLTKLSYVGDRIAEVENNPPDLGFLTAEENAGKALSRTAVCLWVGEQYLHGFSSEFANYFNHDCEGADSDASFRSSGDYIGYNATGFARYLCGYDYQYEITVLDWLADGSPDWEVAPTYDDDGNLLTAGVQKSHMEHRVAHIDGLATDIQNWSGRGVKLYAFALGPVNKKLETTLGREVDDELQVNGVSNKDVQNWNKTFSTVLKNFTWVDIYGDIGDHNPYYEGGGDSGTWYNDQTYQWIFHLMWNTILTLNPNDEPPEPVELSFYRISSSLTSYLNMVLSSSADEQHADHYLPEAVKGGPSNAGAFLGFGDKDYDFKAYLTGNLSKTSSVVDYNGLLGVETDSMGTKTNSMYLYARYGVLLSELGLDKTGTALSVGSPNLVQGGVLYILYVLTSSVNLVFTVVLLILNGLNPFGFFKQASEISASGKASMGDALFLNNTAGRNLQAFIGEVYDGFYSIGFVLLLFLFVVILAGMLLVPRGSSHNGLEMRSGWERIRSWVLRAVFLFAGVPLLGLCYTGMLDYMGDMFTNANANQTKMVGCTLVDFKDWAKTKRLSPFGSDTVLVSVPSSSNSSGGIGGLASDMSYQKLRKTTAVINMGSGAVHNLNLADTFGTDLSEYVDFSADRSDGSAMGNVTEDLDTFRDGLGLIRMYMFGDFYTASDWESDTMAYVSKKYGTGDDATDKIGRLGGIADPDDPNAATPDPPDNTGKLYELFDVSNEASDWSGRSSDDNAEIFTGTGALAQVWSDNRINLYANGGLEAGSSAGSRDWGLDAGDTVYYHGNVNPASDGRDTGEKMGLSTVSLYNYLSTSFGAEQMTIYSNEKAPSLHTKRQHYSVNLIGSGMVSVMYYLSCFALLFLVAVIGAYYGIGILVSNIRNGFRLLLQIPAALIGGMRAIAQAILLVVMMIAEVIGTMVLYQAVSQVTMLFLTAFEGGLIDRVDPMLSTALGGITAEIGGLVRVSVGSNVSYFGFLLFSSIAVIGLSVFMCRKAAGFVRAWNAAREYVYVRCVLCPELRDVYLDSCGDRRRRSGERVSDLVMELMFV